MKKTLLAFALLASMPFAASASDSVLNYDYVEVGYANLDGDADGAYVRGSADVGNAGFYVFGEYARVEIDDTDIDVNLGEVGVGYHKDLTARTDLLGEVAYANVEALGYDADGYRASVGVRSALHPRFNGLAKVNYRDYEAVEGDFSVSLGGEFKINQRWAVVGEVEAGEHHSEQYRVGVRANF